MQKQRQKFGHFRLNLLSEKMRAKMMDWIIEVLKLYDSHEKTIFRALLLFDYFIF